MRKVTLIRGFYRLLINLSLPFVVLRLFWKSRKNPAYRARLSERFALNTPTTQSAIWLHTVSVGEFIATLPLIEQLLAQEETLLITTTTPTGSAMVQEKLGRRVKHCYLPFDTRWIMQRFIRRAQPRVAVFVETEIWANTLYILKKNTIPSLLINARLSEKSYSGYAKMGTFARETLAYFDEIACQNAVSQDRFTRLGGTASVLGNLKFDLRTPTDLAEKQTQLRQAIGNRSFIVAASTHQGEETILLNALHHSEESRLLVIAPRHPERSKAIMEIAKKRGILTEYYTTATTLSDNTQVLIVDTLGQLLTFYSLADYAIIGGSFVPRGGHNPLEAALFATPCCIGEYTFNFESLIEEMTTENAIMRLTAEQLFRHSPSTEVGINAQHFLTANQGSVDKYRELIIKTMKISLHSKQELT